MDGTMTDSERNEADFYIFTRNNVERKIRRNQISLQRLSAMFEVEPMSLYLVGEFGETAEWPNSEGKFHMGVFRPTSLIRVEGRPQSSMTSVTPLQNQVLTTPSTSFSPFFRSVIPPSARNKKNSQCTLKVTLAEKLRGKVLNPTRQTYVLVDESTANVDYIQSLCQQEFGDSTLLLVTANGLKIENSEATRGLNFWKNSSRKIYAVPHKQGKGKNPKRRKPDEEDYLILSDDDAAADDDDDFVPSQLAASTQQELPITFKEDVTNAVLEAFKLGPQERPIYQDMVDNFTCLICKEIIKTDVIVGSCCGTIIGCRECLETWYQSNETCPKCRNVRGDEKRVHLRGFSELLKKAKAISD